MVGGRTVEVDLALSQDEARNLASGGKATTSGSKDNRNLYLVSSFHFPSMCCTTLLLCAAFSLRQCIPSGQGVGVQWHQLYLPLCLLKA